MIKLIIFAKIADWLRQLQSHIMEVCAFIEDLAEQVISIINFKETDASKKWVEVYNDTLWILLLGTCSTILGLSFDFIRRIRGTYLNLVIIWARHFLQLNKALFC